MSVKSVMQRIGIARTAIVSQARTLELARIFGSEFVAAPIRAFAALFVAADEANDGRENHQGQNHEDPRGGVHKRTLARVLVAGKAVLLGLMVAPVFAAPSVVQQTPDTQWNGQGTPAAIAFPGNVTAGNSVICAVAGYNGGGFNTATISDETGMNTYSVVMDSSSGDADSGNAAPSTRAIIMASHDVVGAFDDLSYGDIGTGNYGAWKCYEVSGLADMPNDRACSVQDVQPQAADANCAIGTLAQAEEWVLAVMAITVSDSDLNITGPTGGPSWTNDDIFQDGNSILGYSFDRGVTSSTTGFTVQYSHDNLVDSDDDHSIAVATFKAAAAASSATRARRRMN